MSVTPQPLFQLTVDTAVAIELYRPTASTRLQQIVFLNRDVSARAVSLYHDIDGSDFDDSTLILKDESIASGGRFVFDEPLLLDSNGTLGIKVSAADKINVVGYGWVNL